MVRGQACLGRQRRRSSAGGSLPFAAQWKRSVSLAGGCGHLGYRGPRGSLRPPAGRCVAAVSSAGSGSRCSPRGLRSGSARPRRSPTTASTTAAVTTSPAKAVLVLDGHGWGHGLGMSQWGAYGYAKHGWSYDRILAHYYPGTTLGPATTADRAGAARRGEEGDAELERAVDGHRRRRAPREARSGRSSCSTGRSRSAGRPGAAAAVHLRSRPAALGRTARRTAASSTVSGDGKLVQVVDIVGLEQYLKGVVPAEMPSNWPPAALEAQAVAARSYALANLAKGRPFDLYGDTRSQVYGGIAAESPATSAAVDGDEGRGRALRRQGRGHVVLLDLRRPHGLRARGDRDRRAVPRLGRRSVRHAVAVPRLGPDGARRGEGREGS